MKYGIITHYDVHNHGALLQLNGLKQVLMQQGIEAFALQFDKNYDFMGRAMKAKYEVSVKSVGIYVNYIKEKGLSCFLYNYRKQKTLNRFRKVAQLIGPYYTECKDLDGVVVGSDEVFALHTGPTPVFFGHALPSKKVFAYGGCFGPTTIKDVEHHHCRAFVSSGLESMSGLGMRDENSIRIAKELTGKDAELVCDPVILYGYEKELSGKLRPMQDKYLVVYAYDNRMNNPEEYKNILDYARKNGLKIVSPGFYHSWVDVNMDCDPIELLNWFQYSECVITDTFHGCVMSIITGREMAVKLRDNANKLLNLMEEYGIESRQIEKDWDVEKVFSTNVDWSIVNEQIASRRARSMDYLNRMIAK